mmetsp:Transcript_4777/g.14395  ORF Transcript_4777/g.14395 Transcript_4777/m.14395 type:complete len:135 (+) Transcript_4777:139-543(+)
MLRSLPRLFEGMPNFECSGCVLLLSQCDKRAQRLRRLSGSFPFHEAGKRGKLARSARRWLPPRLSAEMSWRIAEVLWRRRGSLQVVRRKRVPDLVVARKRLPVERLHRQLWRLLRVLKRMLLRPLRSVQVGVLW